MDASRFLTVRFVNTHGAYLDISNGGFRSPVYDRVVRIELTDQQCMQLMPRIVGKHSGNRDAFEGWEVVSLSSE